MRRVTAKVAASCARRTSRTLVVIFLASLLALALTLTTPLAAQETGNEAQTVTKNQYPPSKEREQTVQEGGQQVGSRPTNGSPRTAARASNPLQGAEVRIIDSDDGTMDRIEIDRAGCDVDKGATVTVANGSGDTEIFLNGVARDEEVTSNIEANQDRVIINGIGNEILGGNFGSADNDEEGTVTSASGIECDGRDDENVDRGDNGDVDDGDDARTANELQDLSCEELLVLFRAGSSSSAQYGDATALADSDVQARIEVCLEQEVVQGTAAGEDLPDTGGVSLLGLAVLGIVSAAAGLSMIRGGRRDG